MRSGAMVGRTTSLNRRAIMLDLVFLAATIVLFAACALLVRGCERL
jgi:hypothetical protein